MSRYWPMRLSIAAIALMGAGVAVRRGSLRSFERKTLNPGVRSNATPADLGIEFERVSIPSGPRILDGFLVRAGAGCARTGAVLVFHGRNETIADWIAAQRALRDRCVSSLAFDYSGHGHSSPPGTVEHLNTDAVSAYGAFLSSFPASQPRCVLSHSLGAGPLLYAVTHAEKAPDCVVLASPFSSLRDLAVQGGLPRWLRFILPDVWNNVEAVAGLTAPLLWVHSRSDSTMPIELGQQVYQATMASKSAAVLDGLRHNAIYDTTPADIWSPIVALVLRN